MKPLKTCPLCGSRKIRRTTEDLVLPIRRRRVRVKGVDHEKCLACGEAFLGPEAGEKIDAVVFGRKDLAA